MAPPCMTFGRGRLASSAGVLSLTHLLTTVEMRSL